MVGRVILPWPSPKLTPNAKRRTHWSDYRPAIKADRKAGWALTREALGSRLGEVQKVVAAMPKIGGVVRFVPPDRRKRDDDGMIAAFKHLRDGMFDALGLDDAKFRPAYEFAEPEKPGRVEVTIGSPS